LWGRGLAGRGDNGNGWWEEAPRVEDALGEGVRALR